MDFTKHKANLLPAALSGGLFGLAFLTRYDAILVIVPVVILLIWSRHKQEHRLSVPIFLITLTTIGIHAWIHMAFIAPCYRPLPDLVFPLLQGSTILAMILLSLRKTSLGANITNSVQCHSRLLKSIIIGGFGSFLIFAWYIRPHLVVDGRILHMTTHLLSFIGKPEWLNEIDGANALNIHFLTAIFGPITLFLGCLGVGLLAWRCHERGVKIWLLSSLFVMMILVTNVFNDHFMMWVSRRFIPVVIPLMIIGIVVTTQEIYGWVSKRFKLLAAGLSAATMMGVIFTAIPHTWAMASSRDWPGLCDWMENLANRFPAGATIYCDQPGFAAPLRFMYGLNAYESYGDKSLVEFVREYQHGIGGKRANEYILTSSAPSQLTGITLEKTDQLILKSHIQIQPRASIPHGVKGRGGLFWLYRIGQPANATSTP